MDEEDIKKLEVALDYLDKIVPILKRLQIKIATEVVKQENRRKGGKF